MMTTTNPNVVIDRPARRITIEVTDKMIRAWWTRNHPRSRVPPRRRAFFMVLKEILFTPFRWAFSLPESADRPTEPVPAPPIDYPPRPPVAVHLLTSVRTTAPPRRLATPDGRMTP